MKVLIVGLNYAPEPVGIGPYTAGMAEALATRGIGVQMVTGRPYYPQWRPYPRYSRGWRRSVEHAVEVTRCPHYVPRQPSGARRIAHLASFGLSALVPALVAARRRRPDVVLCVVPALLSVPAAWLAAKLCGAKLWLHMQDLEVEAAAATGLLRPGSGATRAGLWFERKLLSAADRVSTISPQMAARVRANGVPADRVLEIRNWARDAQPAVGDAFRRAWGLEGRTVALYSGNIANKQGIEILVEAARDLAGRPDIALVICGEGPNRARLEALASGLPNVSLHDLQPAERLPELLATADIHLLPQIAGAADLVLPSKLTNMLASGRPVIATALPGSGLAAEVEGCGVVTPPGDAAALAAAIVALADDPAARAALGEAGAQRAAERWSRARVIDLLESELRRLVPG